MSTIKQQVASGIFSLGSANIFSQVVTWVFTILVARLLQPQDYGLIGMAAVYIGFAELFNEFGIGAAIIQRKELDEEILRATYSFTLLLGGFLTCLSLPIAYLLSTFFNEPRLVGIIQALSITFLISAAKNVQMNLMNRRMEFAAIARIEVIARIGSSLLTYVCAWYGLGYWSLIIMYLSYNGLQTLLYFHHVRLLPGRILGLRQLSSILNFGGQVMLARVISFFTQRVDTIIIGKLADSSILGSYSMALNLGNQSVDKIMAILNKVFFPLFARAQDDKEKLRAYFLKIIAIEFYILLPVFILLFYTADTLLPLLLGLRWKEAVLPFKVFMVVAPFVYIRSRLNVLATAIGQPKSVIYINTVMLLAMGSSMLVLGYQYQIKGILAAWMTVYSSIILGYLLYLTRSIGISTISLVYNLSRPLLTAVLLILFIFFTSSLLPEKNILTICAVSAIALPCYLALLALLDRPRLTEVLSLLKNLKSRKDGSN